MTRTVLVTGGSGGIGRAIAARFLAAGDEVFITGRDSTRLGRAADELGAKAVVCDAASAADVASLTAQLGPSLHVLVNNAGGNTSFDWPEPDTGELAALLTAWRANLDANLLSAVLTTEAVKDKLVSGGSVISLGSIGAERGAGSYGVAKAALAAWNISLSSEIGPRGVTANVISAGYIAGTGFFRDSLTSERREALIAATHDKRPGEVADIAETAFFLASPGARHITAQTIHVNGGAFPTR
jgi:NAD(P)-dependent dehydrogenase (short-subunit alcohol dehydrogenase family)